VLPQILEWGLILSRPHTQDLIEARHLLEVFVARRAAERATPEGAPQLDSCIVRMAKAEALGNIEACIEADIDFHLHLTEMAGNAVVAEMLRGIRVLLHVWMTKLALSEGMTQYSRDHALLADAVTSGDPDRAERIMHEHISSGGKRLLSVLPADEEPT
jgi:GntR family transcriptional repressor for pyruvate dehydrogenase complex